MNRINIKKDCKPCQITASEQLLINLALDEYKALRAEVVSSVDRQYSLANWGISAIGGVSGVRSPASGNQGSENLGDGL